MQNQENSQYKKDLGSCRKEIDEIDDKIINLLNQRINIVSKVKKIKEDNQDDFFIKSAREADMIKDLVKKSDKKIHKSIIANIWRKIITSSNMYEQPLTVALYSPNDNMSYQYLLRQYYADYIPINNCSNAQKVFSQLENNQAQIGALKVPNHNDEQENWWLNLANSSSSVKIFAKTPFFYQNNQEKLFILAKKEQEKSSSDTTIICLETKSDISFDRIENNIKECNLNYNLLKRATSDSIIDAKFYLIELDGFYEDGDEKLKELSQKSSKPFIKTLGCCPKIEEL